jgi:SSS family solute:Na+ symporter
LKLLMPVIVVLPGLAALVLAPDLPRPDQAYPQMMQLLPAGLKGLVFAGLIAAIVASLASKVNSIATLFTLDLYARARPHASQAHLVLTGRIAAAAAMALGIATAQPLLGSFDQAFQYIQDFTGFFTPGITVIFLLGLFWKRATTEGALTAAIGSVLLSVVFYRFWPELPFLNRVGIVFLLTLAAAVAVSLVRPAQRVASTVRFDGVSLRTGGGFNAAAAGVCAVLVALYATWW